MRLLKVAQTTFTNCSTRAAVKKVLLTGKFSRSTATFSFNFIIENDAAGH